MIVGNCTNCGTKILDRNPKTNRVVKLLNYAEAIIFLDNDSTMRVAACEDCVGLVNDIVGGDDIRANIVANHKAYWSNEIDKDNRISAKEKVIRKARLDKVDGIFIGKNKKTINNLIKQYDK